MLPPLQVQGDHHGVLQENTHLQALYEGLQMTEGRMQKVFAKNGLKKMHPAGGEVFDPTVHEAMMEWMGTSQEPLPWLHQTDTLSTNEPSDLKKWCGQGHMYII